MRRPFGAHKPFGPAALLASLALATTPADGATIHVDLSHPGQRRISTTRSADTIHLDLSHRGASHVKPGSLVHVDLTHTSPDLSRGFVNQEQAYRQAMRRQKIANDRAAADAMWTYKPPYYDNTLTRMKAQVIPKWIDDPGATADGANIVVGKTPYAFIPPAPPKAAPLKWHVVDAHAAPPWAPDTPSSASSTSASAATSPSEAKSLSSFAADYFRAAGASASQNKASGAGSVHLSKDEHGNMVIGVDQPDAPNAGATATGSSPPSDTTEHRLRDMARDLASLKKEVESAKAKSKPNLPARASVRKLSREQLRRKLVNAMGRLEQTIAKTK